MDERVLVADLQAGHPPVLHVRVIAVGDVHAAPSAEAPLVAVIEPLQAVQIVETLKKKNTPAWFIMARDEGHGFFKKPNVDYQFYATVEFAKQTLLK